MNGTTLFGVASLTFMMVMYVLEHRDPRFIPGFALGYALSSLYGSSRAHGRSGYSKRPGA